MFLLIDALISILLFEEIWRKKRKSVMDNPNRLFTMIHPKDQQHVMFSLKM